MSVENRGSIPVSMSNMGKSSGLRCQPVASACHRFQPSLVWWDARNRSGVRSSGREAPLPCGAVTTAVLSCSLSPSCAGTLSPSLMAPTPHSPAPGKLPSALCQGGLRAQEPCVRRITRVSCDVCLVSQLAVFWARPAAACAGTSRHPRLFVRTRAASLGGLLPVGWERSFNVLVSPAQTKVG